MTLEDVIIVNSQAKIAKLYAPAKRAAVEPTTGVTINIPAAKAVIQDCATVTVQYLPLAVFGLYANPFRELNGKITLDQIQDFVARSSADLPTLHLKQAILCRGDISLPENTASIQSNTADPYGEYDATIASQQSIHDDVYKLSKLFGIV